MVRHIKQLDFGELALVSLKYMSFVVCVNVINQEIIDFWFKSVDLIILFVLLIAHIHADTIVVIKIPAGCYYSLDFGECNLLQMHSVCGNSRWPVIADCDSG